MLSEEINHVLKNRLCLKHKHALHSYRKIQKKQVWQESHDLN